ncbi:4'-phosphopantetheinyl transferase family protein [Paenibacillus paridis]|uniref:4'-phosphopantetheinyl transferase family protein n=1 Tax=Paenibacillus paridis TaxID=2583376 RepID=UPI0011229095|nr:4'-phosphopantetheinyl transferase superfamily protein [Paenibacillus paridis]
MRTTPAIYAVRMNPQNTQQDCERIARWASLVPEDRALRVSQFHHWQDQWRSLAGDMLVRYVLRVQFGLVAARLQFVKNAYNKPYLRGNEVQFNISHSGAWTVAAFHTESIGIDIEVIGKADMELARAMFATSEYEALSNHSAEGRDRLFYRIWTAKESCIKAVGKGLSIPLDSFSVVQEGSVSLPGTVAEAAGAENMGAEAVGASAPPMLRSAVKGQTPELCGWHLRQFELEPDYMLTVCSATDCWPSRIFVVNADRLH